MARRKAEIVRVSRGFDRLELAVALQQSGDPDLSDLGKLLTLDDHKRTSIDRLAQQLGVPYRRVVECYRDSKRLEGIVAVARRLPKVMSDTAEEAESRERTCASCEGAGTIVVKKDGEGLPVESKTCIPCEGTGRIRVPGDPVARKQVMEMMELVGPRAVPIVAPGSNIVITGGSLEDTLRAARSPQREAPTIPAVVQSTGEA